VNDQFELQAQLLSIREKAQRSIKPF